jgi:hypothetical protein
MASSMSDFSAHTPTPVPAPGQTMINGQLVSLDELPNGFPSLPLTNGPSTSMDASPEAGTSSTPSPIDLNAEPTAAPMHTPSQQPLTPASIMGFQSGNSQDILAAAHHHQQQLQHQHQMNMHFSNQSNPINLAAAGKALQQAKVSNGQAAAAAAVAAAAAAAASAGSSAATSPAKSGLKGKGKAGSEPKVSFSAQGKSGAQAILPGGE